MADLSNVVRMLIHQLDATRSYLLPSYCDEDEKARAVIAFAESALAAEPAAPDPREVLAVRPLMERIAQLGDVISGLTVGEVIAISARATGWLAENPPGQPVAIEPRGCPTPGACSCVEPLAPAPGPTIDDIWELCEDHEFHLGEGFDDEASAEIMLQIIRVALTRWGRPAPAPAADGEREELAQWLERIGDDYDDLYRLPSALIRPKLARAAALLREPAPVPVPVPVAERPWEREGWLNPGKSWVVTEKGWSWATDGGIGWYQVSAENLHLWPLHLPHWAIPQPPQGGDVGQ